MDGTKLQQPHSMLGQLCLPLRLSLRPNSRHLLLGRHCVFKASRGPSTSASAARGDQEQLQCVPNVRKGRHPLPTAQAWRSYQSSFGGDLLADAPGGGCSCCGDYFPMREGRTLISRPEAGPSNRSITTAAAATAPAEAAKSHEEEAKALEGFVKRRIELFEQYKHREAQAVSASFFDNIHIFPRNDRTCPCIF